ncbi:MAG: DNA polymerase III subunit beta [bacterium]
MKFTIEKNIILDALTNVTRALSQKITIPVLSGIKFELKSTGLTLLASDSELTIRVEIPEIDIANIENEGDCIIYSKSILDIIRKMPSNTIQFEANEFKVKIFSNTNEYNLNCFELKDYPNFNIQESKESLKITSKDLKVAIDQTSYAMSLQEIRPLLTGTNILTTENDLCFVTTDSYRLSKKIITAERNLTDDINIVLPGRTMHELSKIITDDDSDVYMHFFNNKVVIMYNKITIQSNLLSGSFPETSHFIPEEFAYIINLNLKLFYDAIDRASLLASNKDKNIIKFNIEDKEMLITSASEEVGRTEEKINIDSNKKEKINISMNSKYLLDALKVIKEEDILFLINSEDKPIIIKGVSDEKLTGLILPIQNF